jgi:putative aldouronate transport system substrate-binding protein
MKGLRCSLATVFALAAVVAFAAGRQEGGKAGTASSDYSERLTIQIANPGVTEGYDYNNGDAYAQYWSKKYNFDFKMVRLNYGTAWTEALRIWINSRNMPDVAIFDYKSTTHVDAAAWVEQRLILKLPDNWKTRWPNAAAVVAKTGLGPKMEEVFKGTYFLPRARFDVNMPTKVGAPLTNHMGGYLRRDWAEAVGFPIKDAYTTSEMIDYGKRVLAKDPGKKGTNLIGFSARPEYAVRAFVYGNSTYWDSFYRGDDGKYKWGAASADTLTGLKKMYEAYSNGVLYPEFYSFTGNDDFDNFRIAGKAASAYGGGVATGFQVDLVAYFEKSLGLDSTKAVNVFTVLGEDNHYHQQDLVNYWGTMIFSPTIETKKFNRFMDMVDFGTTAQGYRIEVAGFEGQDYAFKDGKMVSLLPEGQPLEAQPGSTPASEATIWAT